MANVTPAPKLFQLPPSHEGELTRRTAALELYGFQLPPSHEGELLHGRAAARGRYFNSRPRMRANSWRWW